MVMRETYEQYQRACVSINMKIAWTAQGWKELPSMVRDGVMQNLAKEGAWWPDVERFDEQDVPESTITPW